MTNVNYTPGQQVLVKPRPDGSRPGFIAEVVKRERSDLQEPIYSVRRVDDGKMFIAISGYLIQELSQ